MRGEELQSRYIASAEAGMAPDLIMAPNTMAIEWAAQDLIQPLSDTEERGLLADIRPTALDTVRYEGRLWGVPFQASTVALYYNRELLAEPPRTTDDLLAMVQEGSTLALPGHIYYTYGFLNGYGGQMVDQGGNIVVESESIYAYLYFMRDLAWNENTRYGDGGETSRLFQEQQTAMIIDGIWMLPAYRESLGNALRVTLLPQVSSTGYWPAPVLSTNVCLVSSAVSDAEREAAVAFSLFLTGDEFQGMLARAGNTIPVNTRIGIEDPLLAVFAKQADLASPGIVSPYQDIVMEIAQRMLERVIAEQWSPEEAAKSVASELYEAGIGR